MSSAPPISSLRLLVPPLRLMSAFMWQIAQRQKVEHYGKLEEFVSVVTKLVPEVLTSRQKATLIMGLRAKMILEMCRDEVPADLQTVKSHIHRIQSSHSSKGSDSEVESLQANLLKLVLSLLEDPAKKEHFFQEVFPLEYGPDFDKALQVLVGHFLSRLEQLLPVPNFKQTSSLLGVCQWELNECVESVCRTESLLPLMQSNICGPLEDNALPSIVEDRIISSLSHPPLMDTVLSIQSNEPSDTQPALSSHSPTQTSQDAEQENEVADPGDQDEELASGLEETALTGQPSAVQSPRAIVEATEEDSERQHFEIEISEAIKHLEKESEMPTQVNVPLTSTEMAEGNTEPKNAEESESGMSGPLLASADITVQESKVQIARVPLTKITLPLELSRSAKDAQNNEASEAQGSLQDPSSPSAPVSSGIPPFKSSLLLSRRLHKCPQCSKRFTYRSELLKHRQTHTSSPSPKCCECGQVFKDAKQLALHRQKNCKMRTYKCIKCGAGFKSLSSWYTHQRTHKVVCMHKCPECGKVFRSLTGLVSHRREHAASAVNGGYACDKCELTFGSYRARVMHQKKHEVKAQAPPRKEREPGKCRFCDETFILVSDLRVHLKTHPEYRPHQCDQCGKCFALRSSLLAHLSNHTGEKPLLCTQCGKRFFNKIQLKSHMRCHSGEKPHMCPHCGKCFSLLGNLNIHVRIHTGEKPYVCHQCGKGFISAGDLQVHQRSHTGEKPYCCNICDKRFVVSSHLTAHKRVHTGERPFSCTQCGKTFVRRYDWSKHMYTHSGNKPFPCSICQKSYTRRTHLNRHMQSHAGH
ncbi:uncharacterized protein [Salminus brasiliensis]|uniref:uncharacterized protein n=1 Tax=Salminus brasiliensis TaxID=930266 RepID=UPI003B82D1AA